MCKTTVDDPHNYDLFAETYNRWMAGDFCRRALPVIERLFLPRLQAKEPHRSWRVQPDERLHLLDLCCGSGQMARVLSQRGLQVLGLDASEQMVRLARQNAPTAEFARMDARSFQLPPVFAGALCTFNALAHIADRDELEAVFRNLRAALLPGAPFLFDLSMEEAYTHKWRGCFTMTGKDHACIVRPSYDPAHRLGKNEITVFRARADNAIPERQDRRNHRGEFAGGAPGYDWVRSDFCIEQKCHAESHLRATLRASGFAHFEKHDAQEDLGMPGEWGRVFFLAW